MPGVAATKSATFLDVIADNRCGRGALTSS